MLLVFFRVAGPFVTVIERSAALISRMIGLRGEHSSGGHSAEELKFIISSSRSEGHLLEFEEDAIKRILDLQEHSVREIMVPRNDIVSLPVSSSLDQVLQEGADGATYRVRVRVIVDLKRILEELRANGLGRQYRILVALPSPRVQGNDGSLTSEALIEDELARVLRDAGFTVLDWRSAAAKAGRPAVAPRARAPLAEVAAWGREHRADIVIRGWVSGPVDHPTLITRAWTGIDYVRFYLDAVVEAVRADTGEVVFSHSVRQPQEGVGRARAVLAALDLVSRRMGHRLVASLLRLPGARSSVVRVAVSGVASATDAQLLQDALAAAPAVRRATRAGFTEGILTVDLLVAADCADRMAAILEDAQALGDFRVQVESEGGGGIRARVVGAP